MQLKLAFHHPDDQPPEPTATPWDRIDEETQAAMLDILARLIARTLEAKSAKEADDE
jgi:hypothetical protein